MRNSCFIIPTNILKRISLNGTPTQKQMALNTIAISEKIRGIRFSARKKIKKLGKIPLVKSNKIYDAKHKSKLPGNFVRDQKKKTKDATANEAFLGASKTYDFFHKVFGRLSLDNEEFPLISSVHYQKNYGNAFWNSKQMIYGDGEKGIFNSFTRSLDIIAHELTHGVIEFEANLVYWDEPGALNEHMSDVFGSLVKQYWKKQTVKQADWLIGKEIIHRKIKGIALRSMKDPGSAFNDPVLGVDDQPKHMKNFYEGTDDNGGVHINSGILNYAFYNIAVDIGGYAWNQAGNIWYAALTEKLKPRSGFQDFANITLELASNTTGSTSKVAKAVKKGWEKVGITAKKK